ncbi:MAG TPA: hypothetical protein VMM58_13215 [Bacteroidota bacterium]|nr:hypothetical protein [Bacteroidota bacterium]
MKSVALYCCMVVVIFSGCLNPFAPALNDANLGSGSVLGDQTTIDGIFQNFKQAYLFKDTTIYGQVLAPDFIFVYRDYDKGVDVFWGRDDDMRTTNGLFQNAQRLDLVWNNTVPMNGDTTDLKINVTRNFNLTVTFSPSDIVNIDGYASLTLERSSSKDVWRIARWDDQSNY